LFSFVKELFGCTCNQATLRLQCGETEKLQMFLLLRSPPAPPLLFADGMFLFFFAFSVGVRCVRGGSGKIKHSQENACFGAEAASFLEDGKQEGSDLAIRLIIRTTASLL
jgi:hypothetical protein